MAEFAQPMRFPVDMEKGLTPRSQRSILRQGDAFANRVIAVLTQDDKPFDASSMTVVGTFIRPRDEARIDLEGEANGNEVSVLLDEKCYEVPGAYTLDIMLVLGEKRRTILTICGEVERKGNGELVISGVVENLDEKIEELRALKAELEGVGADLEDAAAAQMAAIQQKGEATLATIPEEYADLDADVKSLKDTTTDNVNDAGLWENGNIASGANSSSNAEKYVRLAGFSEKGWLKVKIPSGYLMRVVGYDPNTLAFVGLLRTTGLFGSSGGIKKVEEFNLTDYPDYIFRFMIENTDTTQSVPIEVADDIVIECGATALIERAETIDTQEEENESFVIVDPDDAIQVTKIRAIQATAAGNTIQISNRNILPDTLSFVAGNTTPFESGVTHQNPHERARSDSFAIPMGAKILTFSGLDDGYEMSAVRPYRSDKTYIDDVSGLVRVNGDGTSTVDLSGVSEAAYIHLVFKRTDGETFSAAVLEEMPMMLEIGNVSHDYIESAKATTEIGWKFGVWMPPYTYHAGYQIIWAIGGAVTFNVSRREKVEDRLERCLTKDFAPVVAGYHNVRRNAFFSPLYRYEWYDPGEDAGSRFTFNTTSAEYHAAFAELVAAYPDYITQTQVGLDASGAYPIYRYDVVPPSINVSGVAKHPKILIVGAQHGYEKGAAFELYDFVRELCENWKDNPVLDFIRWNVEIHMIPLANPWGFNNAVLDDVSEVGYENANGVNLNRDWDAETPQAETVYMRALIEEHPDAVFFIDAHSHGATRTSTNYAYLNWLSMRTGCNQIVLNAAKAHMENFSARYCADEGIAYTSLCRATVSTPSGGMTSIGYAQDVASIPAMTFETAHMFPPASESVQFSHACQRFNLSAFVNWLGALLAELKTLYVI